MRSWSFVVDRHGPVLRPVVVAMAVALLWIATSLVARAHHRARDERAAREANAGHLALAQGQPGAALRPLREAVALQPDEAEHRLALGQALIALGRNDEAITYLSALTARDPVWGEANLAIARAHRAAGRITEAERFYYRAVYGQWGPGMQAARVEARLELIELLQESEEPTRVRSEFLQLANAFPGDRALQIHVGQSLVALGFPSDAAQVFSTIVERFADPGPAHAWLAIASFDAGSYTAALSSAAQALRLDASDATAARVRARASSALALDPTLPHLSAAARNARWRRLIEQARDTLPTCHPEPMPPQVALLVEFAGTALSRRSAPELLANAGGALARAVAEACPPPRPARDTAPAAPSDALLLVARGLPRPEVSP